MDAEQKARRILRAAIDGYLEARGKGEALDTSQLAELEIPVKSKDGRPGDDITLLVPTAQLI